MGVASRVDLAPSSQPRRATLLWWSGLALIGLFCLVVIGAVVSLGADCDADCGDRSRGMFVLVVASTPLAAVGAVLAWLAVGVGSPRGAPKALRKVLLALLGAGLVAVAVGLALLAVAAFVEAGHQFNGWLTGDGLSGPVNYPDYMRDMARGEGIFMGVLGLVCLALAVTVFTPILALARGRQPPGVLRVGLVLVGWCAVAATLFACFEVALYLAEGSPADLLIGAGLLALPAALAAGAFLAAKELGRRSGRPRRTT